MGPNKLPHLPSIIHEQLNANRYGLTAQNDAKRVVPPKVDVLVEELRAWSCSPSQLDKPQHVQVLAASHCAGVRIELLRLLCFCRKHVRCQIPLCSIA